MTIPEIATQIISKMVSQVNEDSSRTIFVVGSKSVGKSTLLNSFLEKTDTPRESLVLEYSFGRKTNQKQGIEKTICHVWEYGGKLDILKSVLPSVPIRGRFFYCIMVDLSKIKSIWNILETCIDALNKTITNDGAMTEIYLVCGKYDLFKNYDSEIKKLICLTLRSFAIIYNATLMFYSSKEQALVKRVKDTLQHVVFANSIPVKEKSVNFTKPLFIPKGSDSWENIGVTTSTIEQVKARHISRFPLDADANASLISTGAQRNHPEPALDSLVALKYEELRNLESFDISIDDYLLTMH